MNRKRKFFFHGSINNNTKGKTMRLSTNILAVLVVAFCAIASAEETANSKKITSLNLKQGKYSSFAYLLFDYFTCRAVVKNTGSECDALDEANAKLCRENFGNPHGFYGELVITRNVTPDILNNCEISDRGACVGLAHAIARQDTSICEKYFEGKYKQCCLAMATLDPKLAYSPQTLDFIYYLKALSSMKEKDCSAVKNEKLRFRCKAFLKNDISMCEQDSNFQTLLNKVKEDEKKEELAKRRSGETKN